MHRSHEGKVNGMRRFEDTLFDQEHISNHILKNRYIVGPMTRVSSEADGTPNERVHQYYERFAKGGFAAVITEGTYPDTQYSQGYEYQAGLATEKHAEAWEPIVRDVKAHGAKMIVQLMHAGGQSQGNYYTDTSVAPSPFQPPRNKVEVYGGKGEFPVAKEMTKDEIEDVKDSFVQSARYAQAAGFDGIELHGANGYLLDQFLSENSNKRTDEYGGSIENRVRLLVELIEDVREAVGEQMILGIRISQLKATNGTYKWPGGEQDAEEIFSKLGETDVDYIHLSDDDASTPGFGEGTMTMSEAAKRFSGKPIIACGSLSDPEKASRLISEGQCDFVAIARQALANPDTPNRVLNNKPLNTFDADSIMKPKAYVKDDELSKELMENE
ncbi:2,4-dienoyl-CoA reductase-like NADH-dependent reductase (Old Yellow Enzyme family) [Geomicrobium halophilum]|uniref:2,4-dienoyl-CoA reductase-like NADH-dependent reductase (Old Yellow Enzyme family) n=1 Tax=Geomicrobium halophilum TaxID=549000 RepID=A0A841PQV3_9BACL|nr:NADH:flavin oxidoreductase [Geomicrobium halophilum]MBB6451170.1 2,4-dienoyl-CoA reductase-like NADH-dependent reductase (Old Yellow Enzyme family) [Geomicrobium halophilum]